jgi:hypothetical protein
MARIVVGSPNLTQPLLLYPGLEPAMLEQHRQSFICKWYKDGNKSWYKNTVFILTETSKPRLHKEDFYCMYNIIAKSQV